MADEKVLVTGAAGFIGFHLTNRLLDSGRHVIGIDNLNDYYDVNLKRDRLAQLEGRTGFSFALLDVDDGEGMQALFTRERFTHVVHLAAQAGVPYSLENPQAYVKSNVSGFVNVLEGCRHHDVRHLVFASSSSVYGLNTSHPSSVHQHTEHPISLYAATKKSNELMAHCYSKLFGMAVTGLRFFTVYGPWGRPDMALFLFTDAILAGRPIDVFNYGRSRRSFTYVDDIVEGISRVMVRPPEPDPGFDTADPDPSSSTCRYRIYNIGNDETVELDRFIKVIEAETGKKAARNELPERPGDVAATYADISDLERDVGYRPTTSVEEGVKAFVAWYREYYKV